MLTIISSFIFGLVIYLICGKAANLSNTWSVVYGVIGFLAAQIAIGFYIRKKVNQLTEDIQMIMTKAQNKINRKMNQMQMRPVSSPKAAQQLLEKDQNLAITEALEATKKAERYFIWNIMLKKQINTMRMMLYYQLHEYKKVDELLPKCFIFDSRSVAIKAVRMYKKNDAKLDKYLTKKCKRFKGDDAVLLYALYSWILVKQEKYTEAAALLAQSKIRVDNPILNENHERLVNGKNKHFSNANLGELWYSLFLEEPKIKQQRMVQRGY